MKAIARHAGHRFRRHAREVWESRGGGFYGFVVMLTFVYLEAASFVGDVVAARGVDVDFGGVVGWVVQNLVQAVENVVWAAIWPVAWINRFGVGLASAALLAGAYVAYRLLHPTILRLLRDPEAAAPEEAAAAAAEKAAAAAAEEAAAAAAEKAAAAAAEEAAAAAAEKAPRIAR